MSELDGTSKPSCLRDEIKDKIRRAGKEVDADYAGLLTPAGRVAEGRAMFHVGPRRALEAAVDDGVHGRQLLRQLDTSSG